jgi:hypothetical protein
VEMGDLPDPNGVKELLPLEELLGCKGGWGAPDAAADPRWPT